MLGIELLLSLGLLSNATGIFVILAMPLVGIAWLPAAYVMVTDIRNTTRPSAIQFILTGLTGLAGLACLALFAKWTLLALFVR